MSNWLHFIGKSYYTIPAFEREARTHGVSRRIDRRRLKEFEFGDDVFLMQWQGKSSVLFGSFRVQSIWGDIPAEVYKELEAEGKIKHMESLHRKISRGCGSYILSGSCAVTASLPEIAEKIERHGGKDIMIGGPYHAHEPNIRSKIPHQQGFRLFDYVGFANRYRAMTGQKRIVVPGHWYGKAGPPGEDEGEIKQVMGYNRKEALPKEPKQLALK